MLTFEEDHCNQIFFKKNIHQASIWVGPGLCHLVIQALESNFIS